MGGLGKRYSKSSISKFGISISFLVKTSSETSTGTKGLIGGGELWAVVE